VSTQISHIPFYGKLVIPGQWLFAVGLAYLVPVALLTMWRPMFGIAFAALPIVVLLVAHGPSAMAALIAATFLYYPYETFVTLLPADILAFILIAAWLVDLLCRGPIKFVNPIARPYLLYVAIIILSIFVEGFNVLSVKFGLRQIVLVLTFLAASHFARKIEIRVMMLVFAIVAVISSCYSLYTFLAAGGAIRAFGLAGHGFGDHALMGFIVCSIFYLWARDARGKILWMAATAITFGAMIATQTRASIITGGWAVVLLILYALWAGKRLQFKAPKKNLIVAAGLIFLAIPILYFYTPLFEGVMYRFGRIGIHASGTILLRMTLWKAALEAFWLNPLLGIGAGNFAQVYLWIPEVRFDPIFYLVSGLSTHAVIMTALAETGILGLVTLMIFYFKAIIVSFKSFDASVAVHDLPVAQSLYIIALVIMGSSVYAGSWFWGSNSYHMALFFAFIAAYSPRRPSPVGEGKAE